LRRIGDKKMDETQQAFNDIAWTGFMTWAWCNMDFHGEFQTATGIKPLVKPKSAIEAMIDDACGVEKDYFRKFAMWVTETYWGMDYAPVLMREEWEKMKKVN
jgi:hypothetical protein